MEPIIIAMIGILAAPLAAVATWMVNRKKYTAEIYNVLSNSSQNAVETMQITMNELRVELTEAKVQISKLIKENELLRQELRTLRQNMTNPNLYNF